MSCKPSPLRVIQPIDILSKVYTTTAPVDDYPAYDPAVPVLKDDIVIYENRLYVAQVDGAESVRPDIGELNDVPEWVLKGTENSVAMFDSEVNTQTVADNQLTITIRPNQIVTSLALLDVEASNVSIKQTDLDTGDVVFSQNNAMVSTANVFDPWTYGYAPIRTYKSVLTHELRPYSNCEIEVTINRPNGQVKCGMCSLGYYHELGYVTAGFKGRIIDFSNNKTNDFGVRQFVRRLAVKIFDLECKVPRAELDFVYEILEELRSQALVFNSNSFKSLDLLAYIDDFELEYTKTTAPKGVLTINLVGMI